ncbi:MAG: dienelactone hydrolase family protein [Acetobacteraceae bacterium]|nr:dienelactone hydrolase family protein [Acetobacteraceae bacterium]
MSGFIELTASDGFKLAAYSAGPTAAKAGIVVIQEIFGVNNHIRNMCERFSAHGYAVVAPAVYDRVQRGFEVGYTADDIATGRDVRMKLNDTQLMLDVEAAAKFLAPRKLGIVGYCFGGTVAWWGTTRSTSFSAAASWYGGGVAGTKDEKPNCPVQFHLGEKDASIPQADIDAIRAAQPKAETFVYSGAQHGFGCDERGSYTEADYEVAQKRTLDFFAKNLR